MGSLQSDFQRIAVETEHRQERECCKAEANNALRDATGQREGKAR
jgi:hypothetical protein